MKINFNDIKNFLRIDVQEVRCIDDRYFYGTTKGIECYNPNNGFKNLITTREERRFTYLFKNYIAERPRDPVMIFYDYAGNHLSSVKFEGAYGHFEIGNGNHCILGKKNGEIRKYIYNVYTGKPVNNSLFKWPEAKLHDLHYDCFSDTFIGEQHDTLIFYDEHGKKLGARECTEEYNNTYVFCGYTDGSRNRLMYVLQDDGIDTFKQDYYDGTIRQLPRLRDTIGNS